MLPRTAPLRKSRRLKPWPVIGSSLPPVRPVGAPQPTWSWKRRNPSRNEIERIWQLECSLGMEADQIAFLVADVHDDGLAEVLDLGSLLRLELRDRERH